MSKLEDLVPPLELCKEIPDGAFADSALVWNTTVCDEDDGEIVGVHERDDCEMWMHKNQIPAPTLPEIMKSIGRSNYVSCHISESGYWVVNFEYGLKSWVCPTSSNPVEAALKLWLERFGIGGYNA